MIAPLRLTVGTADVSFRPVTPADRGFLAEVYAATRAEELAALDWSAAQKNAFLAAQFTAQDQAYTANYAGAERLVIAIDGQDAGRLYLHQRPGEIRIMDIALLPPQRRRGIGGAILRQVLAAAAATGCRASIHVEIFNPARALYERLGFAVTATGPVYLLMEWAPPPA